MDFMSPSAGVCRQCGFSHPPLAPGEKCPMAKEKTENGNEIDLDNFLLNMKTIMVANIKKNNIEDIKKFTNYMIIELNKLIEKYRG